MKLISPAEFAQDCCYGISARGGTQGVGRATTQAVVAASVLIRVTDFFVTRFLISILSFR
jgi:phospholipid/cholesterol/gamma-HCH transport system permease protein